MSTIKVSYKDGTEKVFTDVEVFTGYSDHVSFYCFAEDQMFNQKKVFIPLADMKSITMYREED